MRKSLVVLAFVLLFTVIVTGCNNKTVLPSFERNERFSRVEHLGTVPEDFENVVDNNLFYDVKAFGDRLLRVSETVDRETFTVDGVNLSLLDKYGNITHSFTVQTLGISPDAYFVTSEGDVLLSICDYNNYSKDIKAGKLLKYSPDGTKVWETSLEEYPGIYFTDSFERDGNYYFFGTQRENGTDTVGGTTYADIMLMRISKNGDVEGVKRIAGSDFDTFLYVKPTDAGFDLTCDTQSVDGDFSKDGYWSIQVDLDLNITKMTEIKDSIIPYADRLGILDGEFVYSDAFGENKTGYISAVIDYGSFYIIVSENMTGIYEKTPPYISAVWYNSETVYAAYKKNGELLWRSAVDSTRWDDVVANYQENGTE